MKMEDMPMSFLDLTGAREGNLVFGHKMKLSGARAMTTEKRRTGNIVLSKKYVLR